jgi:hypothetical protein
MGRTVPVTPNPVNLTVPRRITEGKTHREVIRCLKRYIAREIYRIITSPPRNAAVSCLTSIGASVPQAVCGVAHGEPC